MSENFSKRSNKIFESTSERVIERIENFAKTWKRDVQYQIAFRDGAPDGVLQFYLVHENFKFASVEEQTAFLNVLCITDTVISKDNARIIEEADSEPFIEVEPRKEIS
jgi:hypothetical protein